MSSVGEGAPDLVLASASPRRLDLLRVIGLEPMVVPADVDETPLSGEKPRELVERLARIKAEHVHAKLGSTSEFLVIAADTVIDIDGEVFGKPIDDEDGIRMLRALRGRSHDVLTGIAVVGTAAADAGRQGDAKGDQGTALDAAVPRSAVAAVPRSAVAAVPRSAVAAVPRSAVAVGRTEVWLRPYDEEDLSWYIGSGEPRGKAGAYAIQGMGSLLVDRVEGNYQNVVGLSLPLLDELLSEFGHSLRELSAGS